MDEKQNEKLTQICVNELVTDESYWVDLTTIVKEIELPLEELEVMISKSDAFVLNKEGKLTTRKLYREKTPFLSKLIHSFKNQID